VVARRAAAAAVPGLPGGSLPVARALAGHVRNGVQIDLIHHPN
jgi:hypothetical protein